MPLETSARPRKFLPEVQALRALAVGLVVIYHLYPKAAPGGFVGVDVFFVISGFLITGHLLREVEATGRVSLPNFWAARVRRIMPAALVTIAVVVLAAPLIWPVTQWDDISRQALASVFSVENWVLAADSVDYLAKDNAPTALQHFWSLGVEEQFYVVWPLVVLLAAVLGRWWVARLRGSGTSTARRRAEPVVPVRTWAVLLFAVVAAASLAYAMVLMARGDSAAYFVTTTRVWELAAGGLLAALLPAAGWGAPLAVRKAVALLGLATLVWVAFAYSASTPFPGVGALPPVLGTLAIIAAGRTTGVGSLHPVTDFRPVQWLGNVSYSLYLWHWPLVMAFVQLTARHARWWEAVLLGLASLGLAAVSYYVIETPARTWRFTAKRTWRALALGAAATGMVAVLTVVPSVRATAVNKEQEAAAQALLAAQPKGFGAQAWVTNKGAALVNGQAIVPTPGKAAGDRLSNGDCFGEIMDATTPRCVRGDVNGTKTVALVGDSHAEQWQDTLQAMAQESGWRLLTYVKKSCPFTPVKRKLERDGKQVCTAANALTLQSLLKDRPDVVIVASWSGASYVSNPRPGFASYLSQLEAAGSEVVVLRDTPLPSLKGNQQVRDCVAANPTSPERCSTPRKKALKTDGLVDAAKTVSGVHVVDLSDQFCSDKQCPGVIGNVLVYRDANHVGDTYLRTLIPVLRERLPSGVLVPTVQASP